MTTRPNGTVSVSTTDVLIAMLSSDLRGSWAEAGGALRRAPAEPAEPAAADDDVAGASAAAAAAAAPEAAEGLPIEATRTGLRA